MEDTTKAGHQQNLKQPASPRAIHVARDPATRLDLPTPEEHTRLVRQLEESLQEVEFERSLWKATVESMLDPVAVCDSDGRAIYMNSAYSRLVGYQIGRDVPLEQHAAHYRLYHSDGTLYESADLPLQRAALRNEEVRGAEVVHVSSSGHKIYTLWNASPIRLRDGKVVGAVAVGRDTTEQRQAEEMKARLVAIVESTEDAIIGKALDGIVTSWNRGAERLYGYSAEEIVGRPISTIVPAEGRRELDKIMARLREGKHTERLEAVRRRKDGERVIVSLTISPVLDGEGTVVGAAAVARDMTAQKRALDAQKFLGEVSSTLSESLEYEDTLGSVASLAVPILADLCIVDVIEDHQVRQCTSSHNGQVYDKWLGAIQAQSAEDDGAPPFWEVMRTGKPRLLRAVSPDGASVPPEARMPATLIGTGAMACLIVPLVIRGRTAGALSFISMSPERKHLSEDLGLAEEFASRAAVAIDNAKLYRDAKNAVQARDEFLSIAAHELKTPMTSLRGFVQLAIRQLERDGALDPMQTRQAMRVIDQQSRHLSALISQLLDVTRLEAGRLSVERRVVDLSSLVEGAVAAAAAANTEHVFAVDIRPMLLALVDPQRIEQVVTALLENAAKFSPIDSQIDLELSQSSRETIRLSVRDRGPGVPPEHRSQIFTRFYHGHPSQHASGMGLGLYVSREIVLLHGGSIAAEFPEDGGSRFIVTLPTNLGEPT